MNKIILVLMASAITAFAQQPIPPSAPPPQPRQPGEPFQFNTNVPGANPTNPFLPNRYTEALTNQPGAQTNPAATTMAPVEVVTLAPGTNLGAVNFTITNTLSAMAPAQARSVLQFQNSLNTLQALAAPLRNAQNIQTAIQQNAPMQQQVQLITTQIIGLAQGEAKPSNEVVQRLALDLVRASTRAQMTAEIQLVLALTINVTVNSGNLSAAQVETTVNNALTALQAAGVPRALAHPVSCDLHAIAYELQPNLTL